jgi:hypothetical protein
LLGLVNMKALIHHLLKCNSKEVLSKSLLHCHVKKLHSIMLLDHPGKTIRMFVAEPGNELWKNDDIRANQSLAYHSHHCELTLTCIYRSFANKILTQGHVEDIPEFEYQSKIKTGKVGFKKLGRKFFGVVKRTELMAGDSVFMKASDIHTVSVPKNTWAAWLVFEGREDKNYSSKCYSYTDLEKTKLAGLYKPMDKTQLKRLLKNIGL